MIIHHHIHYIRTGITCYKQEFHFEDPVDLPPLIDNSQPVYSQSDLSQPGYKGTLRECKSIVSPTGVLHVTEVAKPGMILSLDLLSEEGIQDVILHPDDDLLLLPRSTSLLVWITAGSSGILVVKAKVVQDKGQMLRRFLAARGDLPLREYYLTQVKAPDPNVQLKPKVYPEIMTLQEVCEYSRCSEKTIRRRMQDGKLNRLSNRKFKRSEVDAFLETHARK
jgi:excisionase family DNA binding protein